MDNIKNTKKCIIKLIIINQIENNEREVKEEKEIYSNYYIYFGQQISIKSIDINELKELFEAYVKKIYEKDGDKCIIKY